MLIILNINKDSFNNNEVLSQHQVLGHQNYGLFNIKSQRSPKRIVYH